MRRAHAWMVLRDRVEKLRASGKDIAVKPAQGANKGWKLTSADGTREFTAWLHAADALLWLNGFIQGSGGWADKAEVSRV